MALPVIIALLLSNVLGVVGLTATLVGGALIFKQFLLGALLFSVAAIIGLLIVLYSFKSMAARGEFKASTVAFTLIAFGLVVAVGYYLPSVASNLNIGAFQSVATFSLDSPPQNAQSLDVSVSLLWEAVKPYAWITCALLIMAFFGYLAYNTATKKRR